MDKSLIILGKIVGVHAIQGGLKVFSYTEPRSNIFNYKTWQLGNGDKWQEYQLIKSQGTDKRLIAFLAGIDDRDQAVELMDMEIAVARDELPALNDSEYYWCDLAGLAVKNKTNELLGEVDHLFSTGANDVMVVEGEKRYLIPFIQQLYIIKIDIENKLITVDWEKDYP